MRIVSRSSRSETPQRLRSSYKKTVLPTGLRIVTEEIPYVRSVSIGVWANVGSRDENTETNGISHFVEHMVFKGTKRYRTHQIAQSLESVGGYLNAFTSKENTCFYARILDEHLPKAVDVLSELVQRPLFEAKEIEKEKQVVLEEIKNIEDDPDDLIHDYFDRTLFPNHALGFPVIGTPKCVKELSRDDLLGHLRKHYGPGQLVVAAAGNLKHEAVVALVEKYFNLKPHRNGHLKRDLARRSLQGREEIFEKQITQAHVCLGTVGYSVKHQHRYPLLLLNTLLGDGMSSRLFQHIREKYGFAYNIYSFANFMSDTGNFGVYVGTDEHKVEKSIALIRKELEKLKKQTVSNAELERTKAQLKGTMMLSLENMSSRMMRLGTGELIFRDHMPVDEILRRVDGVTSAQILETANNLIRFDHFSTVIIKPAKKKVAV